MNKLAKEIKENSITHGSIPFWSWNDKLEEKELRRQIQNMHALSINGFFMHARGGLETEYLSEEWYDCVKVCIDEAKKLGMEAWAYDENGWPSGFAGGKLLEAPENYCVYLDHAFSETFPETLDDIYAIYAVNGNKKPVKTEKKLDSAEKYLIVYKKADSSYVDTMRADVIKKFIDETHVQYKKRLGDDFGKAMPGFFTDEPQYYRYKTPYSNMMEKWFEEEYGYSVFDAIPALFCDFEGAESYRYDFHKMTNTKFTEAFAKQIYDWANENGIQITGHAIEECSLEGQMVGCGSIMPFYEYEHIPGVDYLGRELKTPLLTKQLGSVCAQLEKKKALSEMYACCGWDVTPKELKRIADLQYAGGVNIMCQHLYPYSERGQRKRDYPAHYSDHNPWQSYTKDFNEHYNNLGYMLSMGKEDVDILVIHPIHSAWLTYKRIDSYDSIKKLDNDFRNLFTKLSNYQIPYHFGEESMMLRHASVNGNKIRIGACEYSTVVLPVIDTLDSNTVKLLSEFYANGGRIFTTDHHLPKYVDGKPADDSVFAYLTSCPDLSDDGVFEKLCMTVPFSLRNSDGKNIDTVNSMVRDTKEYGKLYYFTNLTAKTYKDAVLKVNGCNKLCALDILTLEKRALRGKVTENGCEVLLDIDDSESFILCEYDALDFLPYQTSAEIKTIELPKSFTLDTLPENLLTLDRASVSFDGESFTELRPIERIRDNLLFEKYKGKVWLRFRFETEFIPEKLEAVIEKPSVIGLCVNGKEIAMGDKTWFDQYFHVTDISSLVKTGENFITLCIDYYQDDYVYHVLFDNVMESLRNCLRFDTEIEAIYIKGSFRVKTETEKFPKTNELAYHYKGGDNFILVPQKYDIDAHDIVKDGYPFYGGKLPLKTVLSYKNGDATVLKLTGRYAVCDVTANGAFAGTLMFSDTLDLAPYLKEGDNELVLTICNAYRNLLGPHHCNPPEQAWVGPRSFSFEKGWKNSDSCQNFVYDYAFARFGIDY